MAKKENDNTKKQEQVEHNKKVLLEALEVCLGVVTTACKQCDIGRTTFYRYYEEDKEFKKLVDELQNVAIDFAESQLHKQIQDGVPSSTIFFLKTKGKKRGYGDQLGIDLRVQDMPKVADFGVKVHKKKEE